MLAISRRVSLVLDVQREITLAQLFTWTLALAGSAAALSWAFLLFFADHEEGAATFAAGGLALAVWAALHLTSRQHHRP